MACSLCGHKNPGTGTCPGCGSQARHRALARFVREKLPLGEGAKVLEVGPAACQMRHFPALLKGARYTAVDIVPPSGISALEFPHRFLEMEATRLAFSDQTFDLILANYVFPFIRSDYQAMSQVHRCLKANGVAICSADFGLPKTRKASEMAEEQPAMFTDEYRRENGTEWAYGEDYLERLEAAGFFPHVLPQEAMASSPLVLCFKYRDAAEKFLEAL
jgi:ubiquinone/menaquinone biosynthesis C-methylase UbiE